MCDGVTTSKRKPKTHAQAKPYVRNGPNVGELHKFGKRKMEKSKALQLLIGRECPKEPF